MKSARKLRLPRAVSARLARAGAALAARTDLSRPAKVTAAYEQAIAAGLAAGWVTKADLAAVSGGAR